MINGFILKEFGKRIKELRLSKNLSQEKLSHETGFHRTYIGMVERGERNISLTNITVFAKVFQIELNKLMDFSSIDPSHSYKEYEIKSLK
ncbi:MAG: transcriptional regulator [Flavobacterium sp.]|nr:MAG: transcriptional regulator [Flavobacterium sp.]